MNRTIQVELTAKELHILEMQMQSRFVTMPDQTPYERKEMIYLQVKLHDAYVEISYEESKDRYKENEIKEDKLPCQKKR